MLEQEDKNPEKKKKKKKKNNKYGYILLLIPVAVGIYLYTAPNTYHVPVKSAHLPRLQFHKNVNTTSGSVISYNPRDLSRLLERYLRQSTKYHVLCMHHLDFKRPYRACSVRTVDGLVYFMMHPNVTRLYGDLLTVNEDSQSCVATVKNKRYTCASVSWTDGSHQLSGDFCGDLVLNLQLVIDEFAGSNHCRF